MVWRKILSTRVGLRLSQNILSKYSQPGLDCGCLKIFSTRVWLWLSPPQGLEPLQPVSWYLLGNKLGVGWGGVQHNNNIAQTFNEIETKRQKPRNSVLCNQKAKRTIWHRGQFDTADNLTLRTIWHHQYKRGQFDTQDYFTPRTIWHHHNKQDNLTP